MDSNDIEKTIMLCKLKSGKVHQMLISKETTECLLVIIGQMEGSLKLLENEIESIDIL